MMIPPIGTAPVPLIEPETTRSPFTVIFPDVVSVAAPMFPDALIDLVVSPFVTVRDLAVSSPATVKLPLARETSEANVAYGTASIFCRGNISPEVPLTLSPMYSVVVAFRLKTVSRLSLGMPPIAEPEASDTSTLKRPFASSSTAYDRPQSGAPPSAMS